MAAPFIELVEDMVAVSVRKPLRRRAAGFPHPGPRHAPAEVRDDPSTVTLDLTVDSAWSAEADALLARLPESGSVWIAGGPARATMS